MVYFLLIARSKSILSKVYTIVGIYHQIEADEKTPDTTPSRN